MTDSFVPIRRALISVSNKTGLEDLCRRLADWGTELLSTGGTAKYLTSLGFSIKPVEEFTQAPEILEGRVKTLHPKIFGSILARRTHPNDLKEIDHHGLNLIDLVVVNLYPFQDHLGKDPSEQSSWVDIGGPSLIRAAAKNHHWVTVLSDAEDYGLFLDQTHQQPGTFLELRRHLANRSFFRTSQYDLMISSEWSQTPFPSQLTLAHQHPLRYGENPHQNAAWSGKPSWSLLQGKELSFNNLLDAEAAMQLVTDFPEPALAIVKHNNPCGVSWGQYSVSKLFEKAFQADSKSAFGGIIATNQTVDLQCAEKLKDIFLEVVIAPAFSSEAIQWLEQKKNLRLIQWPNPQFQSLEVRAALGGWLIQDRDSRGTHPDLINAVSSEEPDSELRSELEGAWRVCKHVKSNAIVCAKKGVTLGIGAGQMSRVDSMRIALEKSRGFTEGAVIASDAFFPFRDSIDLLKGLGVRAVIQPGGSQKDAEVIQACRELGVTLFLTGERHFKH